MGRTSIGEFDAAIKAHFAKNPYRFVEDRDSKPGRIIHRAILAEETPNDWQRHVTRIVADLREPLDYAAVAVGKKFGAEKAEFLLLPIEDSEPAFEREMKKRKIERRCPELAAFLRAVKPYKGPNDLLFSLHELSRANKHRKLAVIAMPVTEMGLTGTFFIQAGDVKISVPRWESAEGGFILLDRTADSEFHGNIEISGNVALSELEGFKTQPVTAVLMQMRNAVQNLLSQFERQFFSRS